MSKIAQNFYMNQGYINFAKNANYYIGTGAHLDYQNGAEGDKVIFPPVDCTLVRIEARIQVNGTLSSSEDLNINFVKNGSASLLTTINTDAVKNFAAADVSIAMLSTDTYSLELETPNYVTNPTTCRAVFTLVFEFSLDGYRHLYDRFSPTIGTWNPAELTTYYFGANCGATADLTPAELHRCSVPRDIKIIGASLYCQYPGAGPPPESVILQILVDGATTHDIVTDWTWENSGNNRVITGLDIDIATTNHFSFILTTPDWAGSAPTGVMNSINLLYRYDE